MQMSMKRKRGSTDGPSGNNQIGDSSHSGIEGPSKKKSKKSFPKSKKKLAVTGRIPRPLVTRVNHSRPKPQKKKSSISKPTSSSGTTPATTKPVTKLLEKENKTKKIQTVSKKGEKEGITKKSSPGNSIKQKKYLSTKKKAEGSPSTNKGINDSTKTVLIPKRKKTEMAEASKNQEPRIFLPSDPEAISANWKQLQTSLPKKKRGKKVIGSKLTKQNAKSPHTDKPAEPDIWFDDNDDPLIQTLKTSEEMKKSEQPEDKSSEQTETSSKNPLMKSDTFKGFTKCVAMDCEMVGVGDGKDSILARVSIVNHFGYPLYDKFVKPREEVTDYRTYVSGIKPEHLENAEEFDVVQLEISDMLKNRVLVGHALHNDLKVLFLTHPRRDTRDTSTFKPFRQVSGGRTPGLKKLTEKLLGVQVQTGEHSSVEDAQAAMRLYTMHRKEWEKYIKEQRSKKGGKKATQPRSIPSETGEASGS